MTSRTDFNLTKEQQTQFNDIYKETERKYPELVLDDIGRMRVNVLIAHSILNGDNFEAQKEDIEEIKDK